MDSRGALFLLTVKSGLHAGVVQQLPAGAYTLGGGPTADILFSDPGIGAEHVGVELKNSLFGPIAVIKAHFPGVAVNGARVADASQMRTVRLPVDVQFGDIRVSFSGGADAPLSPVLLGGLTAALAVLFLGAAILIFGPKPRPPTIAPATVVAEAPTARTQRETRLSEPPPPADVRLSAARPQQPAMPTAPSFVLSELRKRLQEDGLAFQIQSSLDGDTIRVSGMLSSQDRAKWQQTRYWYDQTFAASVPLTSAVEISARANEQGLRISAVSLNNPPYLLTTDGKRYAEGDDLAGGWRIEKIEDTRVVLKRDTETMSVQY